MVLRARGEEKSVEPTPLPSTKPLTMQGDIAAQLVDGVDKFLLKELDQSVDRRAVVHVSHDGEIPPLAHLCQARHSPPI